MILVHDGVVTATDAAKLVEFGDEQVWVPDSLIQDISVDTIDVEDWWVEKEGLEGYAE